MDSISEDCFLVFARAGVAQRHTPEINEEALAVCDSYEEARRIKHANGGYCVIRYAGSTGGGD
jgi:hypothetical protein